MSSAVSTTLGHMALVRWSHQTVYRKTHRMVKINRNNGSDDHPHLMMVIWNRSSARLFQAPCRNSLHHRYALLRVSGSGWSERTSSSQSSWVSGWTCRAFSVTSRPSDMEGEEETPLMNLVFILSTVRQEVGERGPPPVRVSQKDIFQLFLSVWNPQCGRFLLFSSFLTIIITVTMKIIVRASQMMETS